MHLWVAGRPGHYRRTGSFPRDSNTTLSGLGTSLVLIIMCILIKERYYFTQEEGKIHIKRYKFNMKKNQLSSTCDIQINDSLQITLEISKSLIENIYL